MDVVELPVEVRQGYADDDGAQYGTTVPTPIPGVGRSSSRNSRGRASSGGSAAGGSSGRAVSMPTPTVLSGGSGGTGVGIRVVVLSEGAGVGAGARARAGAGGASTTGASGRSKRVSFKRQAASGGWWVVPQCIACICACSRSCPCTHSSLSLFLSMYSARPIPVQRSLPLSHGAFVVITCACRRQRH